MARVRVCVPRHVPPANRASSASPADPSLSRTARGQFLVGDANGTHTQRCLGEAALQGGERISRCRAARIDPGAGRVLAGPAPRDVRMCRVEARGDAISAEN